MDLEKQAHTIDDIRETLSKYVGQTVFVRANMGRSKIVEQEGLLTQAHPRLFVVEVERKRARKARLSYQYVDILTGMVELYKDGERIFEPFVFDDEEPPITPLIIDDALLGEPLS